MRQLATTASLCLRAIAANRPGSHKPGLFDSSTCGAQEHREACDKHGIGGATSLNPGASRRKSDWDESERLARYSHRITPDYGRLAHPPARARTSVRSAQGTDSSQRTPRYQRQAAIATEWPASDRIRQCLYRKLSAPFSTLAQTVASPSDMRQLPTAISDRPTVLRHNADTCMKIKSTQ